MKFVTTCFYLLCVFLSQAQFEIKTSDNASGFFKKKIFKDSLSCVAYLKKEQNRALSKGYFLCSVDSITKENTQTKFHVYLGEKFDKISLTYESNPELNAILFPIYKQIEKKFLSPKDLAKKTKLMLKALNDNGYPFAQVKYQAIQINGTKIEAKLAIFSFKQYKIKKINTPGDPAINAKVLSSFIQIKEGDFFSQAKIDLISQRIKNIPFLQEIKPAELLFTDEGVEIFIYLKTKPVSLANGVVGLQQDPIKQKVFFNGEFRLKLQNTLRKAELFDLQWRNVQEQTSNLKLKATVPALFKSPFGSDFQFNLYRKDSTFIELKTTTALLYMLEKGSFLKILYKRNSSNVILKNNATSNLKSAQYNSYGLGFLKQTLDYIPNPTKGWFVSLESSLGKRKLLDTIEVKSLIFNLESQIDFYFSLSKRNVIKIGNQTELFEADNYAFNELLRFGGLTSLRGFNEEEFRATHKIITSIEYRFLLDRNSFLFAFYDQGWYENRFTKTTDLPRGGGIGLTFGTAIGNFSISYAVGTQLKNPVSLRDGRVHFGYVSYF